MNKDLPARILGRGAGSRARFLLSMTNGSPARTQHERRLGDRSGRPGRVDQHVAGRSRIAWPARQGTGIGPSSRRRALSQLHSTVWS